MKLQYYNTFNIPTLEGAFEEFQIMNKLNNLSKATLTIYESCFDIFR